MRGAEGWTHYRLVRGKLNFVVKPRNRSCGTKLPKRFNVAVLKNAAVKEKLVREMKIYSAKIHGKTLKSLYIALLKEYWASESVKTETGLMKPT